MDHVVYVDSKSKELEKLADGSKTMIIRGATGRKMPYDRVHIGDVLYFIQNNGDGVVQAKAVVQDVLQSDQLTQAESEQFVAENQKYLHLEKSQLTRWAGKRYLILISIDNFTMIDQFPIDKTNFSNMDDWLLVGKIESVKL